MILPKPINNFYIIVKRQYVDIVGRFSTPQYGVHLFNGHYLDVSNDTDPAIFYETLNQLKKEVDFISIQEGSQLIKSQQIPKGQKLVCFTFDDGFEECFTKLKPVLDAFGIKAAFFICPNFVEAPPPYISDFLKNRVFLDGYKESMTWEQIKTLHKEGHLIASHTLNHINCRTAEPALLDYELRQSKAIIEEKLNAPCDHFAYGYGKIEHFSEAALACAEQYYSYIYSQAGHNNYFSFDGRVLNRRHFEGNWAAHHLRFFMKKNVEL